MTFLAVLLLSVVPVEFVTHDHFTLVEKNHFFDGDGKPVFTQVIWYQWNKRECRYDVVDWRLATQPGKPDLLEGGKLVWYDGTNGLRKVTVDHVRESWTQHDVELTERANLPKELRRELREPVGRNNMRSFLRAVYDQSGE